MKVAFVALSLLACSAALPAYSQSAGQDVKDASTKSTHAVKTGATKSTHAVKTGATKSTHAAKTGIHKTATKVSDATSTH